MRSPTPRVNLSIRGHFVVTLKPHSISVRTIELASPDFVARASPNFPLPTAATSLPEHRPTLSPRTAEIRGDIFGVPRIEMKKPEPATATSSKIRFDDSDDHELSSEDEGEIERELAEVTFEELQRARSDGSEMVYRKHNMEKKGSRANKNRPMEMSSKKPVSRFREVIQVPKKVIRDPRFESLCGNLDWTGKLSFKLALFLVHLCMFKKRYNFIYENILPAEKEELKKQMKRAKDPEAVKELKDRMTRVATRNLAELRKQKLIEKYKELKDSGKLEAFIEKKRRKNAAKDHRYMPYRRPAEEGSQ
ncbi:rRNA biogenesis protein rrp36 [Sesamum angolense]|uniref:rRNA biogenesis protein RRP36 n=1 Tax=Sesamum angolense TaxID=2727404 RepID=A0AAE1WW52_9LAMI|nr:rRNA biogenesis protein rrp36 [Sesamum angolense]